MKQKKTNLIVSLKEFLKNKKVSKLLEHLSALGGPVGMVVGAATGVVVNEIIDAWKALKRWW
ncbi:hypothetical protein [Candidatus Phytoplasma asteris]|uniref:Uncharacterized protein n=2 Tax=16SrI (Aster yellows group) TaxID=3042590 RepID=A0A859I9E3_9MOLU|nr:MAG: hypothetical protein RP166_0830 [Rapeseed phyllody phytoplasma]